MKAAVIFFFSILWLIVSIVRAPESVGTNADIGTDTSWVVGLPEALHQGDVSGRDFHGTYGPVAQLLAFAGAWLHDPWSPLDALPLILLSFITAGILLLALVLFLLKRLDWKGCVSVYLCCAGLNLFSEPTSFRALVLLLSSAVVCRALDSESDAAMLFWAALVGVIAFAGQLTTAELGIYSIVGAVSAFGLQAAAGPERRRSLALSAAATVVVYIAANVAASALFIFSSSSYTNLFDYQRYELEMIRGYNFTAGAPWDLSARATVGLAAVAAFTLAAGIRLAAASSYGSLLLPLMLTSVISLKSGVIRSDTGHITQALSPLIFTFLVIGALLLKNPRSQRKMVSWACAFVVLWLCWPWAGAYAASDIWRAATNSPIQKIRRLRTVSSNAEEVLPPGLASAAISSEDRLLAFPHELYIPVKLQRRLFAPVFQSFNASTKPLQDIYVDRVKGRGQNLMVVYGMDSVASPTLGSVQTITRVPYIFDYLYRHFRLTKNAGFGKGFYLLRDDGRTREFRTVEVAFDSVRGLDGAYEYRSRKSQQCSLLQINLQLHYSLARYLGRPMPVELAVFREGQSVLETGIVSIVPNGSFSTYISLIPDNQFYEVFADSAPPAVVWDRLRIAPAQSDWLGVPPTEIRVERISCLDIPSMER
ncbi:MAG TPA: hypothetical protein VE422_41745 [Terriglobia bacterium]|nr:hypothetical protein [Terriglobia bacterium]